MKKILKKKTTLRYKIKNKVLKKSKTKKNKKNYIGGAQPSKEDMRKYTNLVNDIIGKESKFNNLLRTWWLELRDNPELSIPIKDLTDPSFNDTFSNQVPPSEIKEKIQQVNLRLFCWIRDNVPGSIVEIDEGSIFCRTVSRDDIDQTNVLMKEIDVKGGKKSKPAKPGIFSNTSQLANSLVAVTRPIDAVMFLKTTRKLLYLNIIPFQHLLQAFWKTRFDNLNKIDPSNVQGSKIEKIEGISANTMEWCISKPLQQMELDGLIETDTAEMWFYSEPDNEYYKKETTGFAKHQHVSQKVAANVYKNLIDNSLTMKDNQVMESIYLSNAAYYFPEFLTFSYKDNLSFKVCNLENEFKNHPQIINWNNKYELKLLNPEGNKDPAIQSYYKQYEIYNNLNITEPDKFEPSGLPKDAEKTCKTMYETYKDNPDFALYSLGIYEDISFQDIGTKLTDISHIEFNKRTSNKITQQDKDCYDILENNHVNTGYTFGLIIGTLYQDDDFKNNIDLLNKFKKDMCENEDKITGCDIEKIPPCKLDAYPGSFMEIKGDATNNFYYDVSNREIIIKETEYLINNIVYIPNEYNYPLYQGVYKIIIDYLTENKINELNNSNFDNSDKKAENNLGEMFQGLIEEAYMKIIVQDNDNLDEINKSEWYTKIKYENNLTLYKFVKEKILHLETDDNTLPKEDEKNLNFTYKYILFELYCMLYSFAILNEASSLSNVYKANPNFDTSGNEVYENYMAFIKDPALYSSVGNTEDRIKNIGKLAAFYKTTDKTSAVPKFLKALNTESEFKYIIILAKQIKKHMLTDSIFKQKTALIPSGSNDNIFKVLSDNSNFDDTNVNYTFLNKIRSKIVSEKKSKDKDSFLPLFFNIYLKGGSAFRMLFYREYLIEKKNNNKSDLINRLKEYTNSSSGGIFDEKKLDGKLGQPSDYDLNCTINPWIGENNYNNIVKILSKQIRTIMQEKIYVILSKIYKKSHDIGRVREQNRYKRIVDNIKKNLAKNSYDKDRIIIIDDSKYTLSASVDGISGFNKQEIKRYDAETESKYDDEKIDLPETWKNKNQMIDPRKSFLYYSNSHMLWVTEKLLNEGTEFELHRLMLHIPTKDIWIKEDSLDDKYKVIKDGETKTLQYVLEQNEIGIDTLSEEKKNTKLKKIATSTDTSIELIDVSIVLWGGIEKFTKWQDVKMKNLRADFLYYIGQELRLKILPNTYLSKYVSKVAGINVNPTGTSGNVKITHVYNCSFYYDIGLLDATTKNIILSIKHVHGDELHTYKKTNNSNIELDIKLDNWSNNLQMYDFDNSIHDLSLTIDDNIKSGRLTKLRKRQLRRAFLSQLRYIFVNNNPNEKEINKIDGPIEILRFDGYEDCYDLLNNTELAYKAIKIIFNTNIRIDIPSLGINTGDVQAVKLLSLEEWSRIHILLRTFLTYYKKESENIRNKFKEYSINNKDKFSKKTCYAYSDGGGIEGIKVSNYCFKQNQQQNNNNIISNDEILFLICMFYKIEGLIQNLDLIFSCNIAKKDIQHNIPANKKKILKKYFLNSLTIIIETLFSESDKENVINYRNLKNQCMDAIITDMCNVTYMFLGTSDLQSVENMALPLRDVDNLERFLIDRNIHLKTTLAKLYKQYEIIVENIEEFKINHQIKVLNKICSMLDIQGDTNTTNTTNFYNDYQLILDMDSVNNFKNYIVEKVINVHHSQVNGSTNQGNNDKKINYNKVTLNIANKEKYNIIKEKFKIKNNNNEIYFTCGGDGFKYANEIEIDFEKKYSHINDVNSISLKINSMLYDLSLASISRQPSNVNESPNFDVNNINNTTCKKGVPLEDEHWQFDWKFDDAFDDYTKKSEKWKTLSVPNQDNSPFEHFEPISTQILLFESFIDNSNSTILKQDDYEMLNRLFKNRISFIYNLEYEPIKYKHVDTDVTGMIPKLHYQYFSNVLSYNGNPDFCMRHYFEHLMKIDIISTNKKNIENISQTWGSILNSYTKNLPNSQENYKTNIINQITTSYKSGFTNFGSKSVFDVSGCFYCLQEITNNINYKKLISNNNNINEITSLIKQYNSEVKDINIQTIKEFETLQKELTQALESKKQLEQKDEYNEKLITQINNSLTQKTYDVTNIHNVLQIYNNKLLSVEQNLSPLLQKIDSIAVFCSERAWNTTSFQPHEGQLLINEIKNLEPYWNNLATGLQNSHFNGLQITHKPSGVSQIQHASFQQGTLTSKPYGAANAISVLGPGSKPTVMAHNPQGTSQPATNVALLGPGSKPT